MIDMSAPAPRYVPPLDESPHHFGRPSRRLLRGGLLVRRPRLWSSGRSRRYRTRALATCLRATGMPGGLGAVRAVHASMPRPPTCSPPAPDGTDLVARVPIGALVDCAATATAAGGAAVVAGAVDAGDERDRGARRRARPRRSLRPPRRARQRGPGPLVGGGGGLARRSRGRRLGPAPRKGRRATRVAPDRRRAPPARRRVRPAQAADAVAARRRVQRGRCSHGGDGRRRGSRPLRGRSRCRTAAASTALYDVEAATAAPDTAFAVQRVATRVLEVSRPALSVAPDGWALLAYDETGGVRVLERPARAARFTPAFDDTPPDERPSEVDMPVVAVRDGGGGLVAWRSGYDHATAGTIATMRAAAGAFPAPRTVAPGAGSADDFGDAAAVFTATGTAGAPVDGDNGALRAAWPPTAGCCWRGAAERRSLMTTQAAAGTLDAGFGVRRGSAARCGTSTASLRLFLADGRAALAWTDNADRFGFGLPTDNGRLHLAVESVARPRGARRAAREADREPHPAPVRLAADTVSARPATAPATCGRFFPAGGATAPRSRGALARAGTVRLSLSVVRHRRGATSAAAPAGSSRVPRPPAAMQVTTVSLRVLVVRRPALPVPSAARRARRPRGASRSWSPGARPHPPAARSTPSIGQRRRRSHVETIRDPGLFDSVEGRGRTRFTLRLQSRRARRQCTGWPSSGDQTSTRGAVARR